MKRKRKLKYKNKKNPWKWRNIFYGEHENPIDGRQNMEELSTKNRRSINTVDHIMPILGTNDGTPPIVFQEQPMDYDGQKPG
jgi:hypothetical protein